MGTGDHVKRLNRVVQSLQAVADPLRRLDAVRTAKVRLDDLEAEAVSAARAAGATWRDIGALYGLTKQGAQQRFSRQDGH